MWALLLTTINPQISLNHLHPKTTWDFMAIMDVVKARVDRGYSCTACASKHSTAVQQAVSYLAIDADKRNVWTLFAWNEFVYLFVYYYCDVIFFLSPLPFHLCYILIPCPSSFHSSNWHLLTVALFNAFRPFLQATYNQAANPSGPVSHSHSVYSAFTQIEWNTSTHLLPR